MRPVQTHILHEPIVLLPSEPLGQDIGSLLISGEVVKGDVARLDHVTDEMMMDVDVFSTVMKLQVLCDGDSRLVVDEELNRE